jgi:hypothetical protein
MSSRFLRCELATIPRDRGAVKAQSATAERRL